LVGNQLACTQTNFATLNTNFGTDGWIYLGLIKNGDEGNNFSTVLDFTQTGALTIFSNAVDAADTAIAIDVTGVLRGNNASATSVSYSYVAGFASGSIPETVKLVMFTGYHDLDTLFLKNNAGTVGYGSLNTSAGQGSVSAWMPSSGGVNLSKSGAASALTLMMVGFVDSALEGNGISSFL